MYATDMKVRIQSRSSYYYPDIMVSCEPFEPQRVFKDHPVLLIEILSPSTKQVDLREKLVAYQAISSLKEYVIIYQDRQQIEVHSRSNDGNWEFNVLTKDQDLVLHSAPGKPLSMSFRTIYGDHDPPSRVKEEEEEYDLV